MEPRYNHHQAYTTRKFIQNQTQSLQNRINLLQHQNKRSNKKVAQTNKRANQVLQAKRNYQKKINERIERNIQKQRTMSQKRQYINILRYQRTQGRIFIKASLLQNKKQEAAAVRAVKSQCAVISKNINKKIDQEKREKIIKARQESLFRYTSKSPNKISRPFNRKESIQNLADLKIQKLKLLKDLQNRQAQLVKQLQNAQIIQKQTYEEYQRTVNNNPITEYLSSLKRINSN